jgi:hypothetical protein
LINNDRYFDFRLLTPQDVADLMQISIRTVYDRAHDLGGFYPAGINVLRFRQEVIYGIMEGQNSQGLVLQFRVPEGKLRWEGIQNKTRCVSVQRRTKEASKGTGKAEAGRHGF